MTINLILLTILGLFILLISANYLIENIVSLAKKINISKSIIGTDPSALVNTRLVNPSIYHNPIYQQGNYYNNGFCRNFSSG